ncbi:ABC transporter ATP-binding protein [Deinococcus sp. Leaf326]|jgi:branched-chain amino acid transport system ATP-binding protein|uniref:ABC transporter ATP-binding protein n=1 Tax=Deinococcus sp. Leaf326 TaxID=1736338 RepID=UPI00070119D9|nr:ABC transporter ATP-binding protein [Deinococcus sp. Leaf326]KQR22972.1 ABC transporter ATP-binding protein [Deinococcus sp. Leaf326]
MTGELLLRVDDLHVSYGRVEAVRGVSLNVGAGQIVSVIGANGAGKSTLLAAVMGALPSKGTVEYGGRALRYVALESRVAAGMTLVPERRELFGSMTVEDNLRLGAYTRRGVGDLEGVYTRFPRLRERRTQHAGTLSGGEQQMLAIGRALMARPRLLLLDEPSLGLAPLIVREILRIVAELRASGVTVLIVEQNARAALAISDYGYVLEGGQVSAEGPARQLADDPAVVASYLGG